MSPSGSIWFIDNQDQMGFACLNPECNTYGSTQMDCKQWLILTATVVLEDLWQGIRKRRIISLFISFLFDNLGIFNFFFNLLDENIVWKAVFYKIFPRKKKMLGQAWVLTVPYTSPKRRGSGWAPWWDHETSMSFGRENIAATGKQ